MSALLTADSSVNRIIGMGARDEYEIWQKLFYLKEINFKTQQAAEAAKQRIQSCYDSTKNLESQQ